MKKRTLLILIFSFLILLAAGVLLTNTSSSLNKKETAFAISDTSTVTRIFIADKQDRTVELTKMGSHWDLNGKYKAHGDNIRLLLKTMESIRVGQPVSKASRNTVIKLMAAGATKVEIYQMVYRIKLGFLKLFPHEKCTRTYYVGTHTQDNMGTYMLMEGSENPYVMYIPGFKGFVSSRYHAREIDWREHIIFSKRLPQIASLKLEFPETPEESYQINNNNEDGFELISLSTGKPIKNYNYEKVLDIMSSFEEVNFEAFITQFPSIDKDSIVAQQPHIIISLTGKDGETVSLKTFRRPAGDNQADYVGQEIPWDIDRMYAIIEGEEDLLLIQYFVFDKLTRRLSYLAQ